MRGINWTAIAIGAFAGFLAGYWRNMSRPAHGNAVNPVGGGPIGGGASM